MSFIEDNAFYYQFQLFWARRSQFVRAQHKQTLESGKHEVGSPSLPTAPIVSLSDSNTRPAEAAESRAAAAYKNLSRSDNRIDPRVFPATLHRILCLLPSIIAEKALGRHTGFIVQLTAL